jgi:hypothetical protein
MTQDCAASARRRIKLYWVLQTTTVNFGSAVDVASKLQRDGVPVMLSGVTNKSFKAQAIVIASSIKIFRLALRGTLRVSSRPTSTGTFRYVGWLAKWNGVFPRPFRWMSCTRMILDGAGHVAGGPGEYFDMKTQIVSPGDAASARQRLHADGGHGAPTIWTTKPREKKRHA